MKEHTIPNGEVVDVPSEPGEYRCIRCGEIHHVNDNDTENGCPNA